jgi:hypothetical protein
MSHPSNRQFLVDGFVPVDYSKPSVDLSKDPDFMAFYNFHTEVCSLWNAVIDEVMKNDCAAPDANCPAKPQYIKKLASAYDATQSSPTCFVQCDSTWSHTSTLAELDAVMPKDISCYRGTLEFIINKSTDVINQVQSALSNIPSGFENYSAQQIQDNADKLNKQIASTNKIIGRCQMINRQLPELNNLLAQARQLVKQLQKIKQDAENGTLLPA